MPHHKKAELNCQMCGKVLWDENPASLAEFIQDCGRGTALHDQAELITDKYGLGTNALLCDECFWMFGRNTKPKINWIQFLMGFAAVMLLISILTFGLGIMKTMAGYHALDLAQDINRLSFIQGKDPSTLLECKLSGECVSLDETYREGCLMLFDGIIVTIISAMAIPICIAGVIISARGDRG